MDAAEPWVRAERILCVRLDGLGDLLMTTPALRAVRGQGRHLTLLASAASAAAARLLRELDDVLVYAAPWMKASPPAEPARDRAMIQRLRRGRFDAAVIFTTYSQSPLPAAVLCWLAEIPLCLAHCRENPYHLLSHWLPDPEPGGGIRHEVRRQLDLVASVGYHSADERLSLRVPRAARQRVTARLASAGIDPNRPWIAIHPGATAPSRRYAPAGLAAAADALAARTGVPIVFAGGAAEMDLVEHIRAAMRADSVSLAGAFDLAELAALIGQAAVLIANNSGPAHIAAAVGTPVVDLYALTNPQHTPWQVPHRVLSHEVPCRNCLRSVCPHGHNDCLQRVTPAEIVEAACALLEQRG